MKIEFVDLKRQRQRIKDRLDERIARVLDSGRYIMGPEVGELEEKLARFAGVRHCVGVADGTAALEMALMALGIKRGDEVIVPPFTFIATAEAVALVDATPVFVDIEPRTYNLDPAKLERAFTANTRAIIPVSLFGQCADFDAINAIAAAHRVPVIEDAAQSYGATYKGRRSCAMSTMATTSFYPAKPLGAYGEGGACFTDDDALAESLRRIRVHGQTQQYVHSSIGRNGRLDTLQAAVLLVKLEVFEDEVGQRQAIARRYDELLAGSVQTPHIAPHNTSVYAQYTIEVDDRTKLQAALAAKGVPTAVHYPLPLHLQPAFAALGQGRGSYPVAEAAAARVLSLPMHPYLTGDEQAYIADAVRAALA